MDDTRTSLLSRIKNPEDALSWEEFDRVYRPMLLKYAVVRGLTPEESEDVAQQCMTAIATGIQSFRRQVSFRGWLRGMIEHKVSDQLRKHGREVRARTVDFAREQQREEEPGLSWEREWNRTHLLYCLSRIRHEVAPMTFRAFEMYVLEERSVREIGESLGMTANQIYVAKSRVLAKLKQQWAELTDGLA
ncbi:MAG: sigma-70 family RNA polymerase sigma factor [Phycisphaerales bacterium]|nr:sigma-70 family RNA polymerase sigma factor [Phycisphaerales bacterium]